jgi:SH3 domain-containing YSC84-like protein 1
MKKRVAGDGMKAFAAIVVLAAFLIIGATPAMASDASEAQGLVDKARITFDAFMSDKNYGWFHEHLKDVKGLLIYPQVLKAGFFLGGSGGTGVLVIRDAKTGGWSEPAFYTIGSVSFGAQIGGEASQVIVMAMSRKAIDSLLSSSFKLGGDTSITVGPAGAGAKANITADFISFAKAKGLYAGLNLEGSVVDVRESLNKAYYKKEVTPVDIVVKHEVSNKGAARLRETLKKAVK